METADENLLTFLSEWSALKRTLAIYRSRWFLLTQLALIAIVPRIGLTIILSKAFRMDDAFTQRTKDAFMFRLIEVVSFCVFNSIIQAAIVQVVADYYTQKVSTLKGSLSVIADRWCALFAYVLLYIVSCQFCLELHLSYLLDNAPLFYLFFIYPMMIFFTGEIMAKISVTLPIMMVEKQLSLFEAFKKRPFKDEPHLFLVLVWYFNGAMIMLFVPVLAANWIYRAVLNEIFGASALGIVFKGLSGVVFLPLRTMYV